MQHTFFPTVFLSMIQNGTRVHRYSMLQPVVNLVVWYTTLLRKYPDKCLHCPEEPTSANICDTNLTQMV